MAIKDEMQFVTFTLENEVFGIDVRQAREIIKVRDYTKVPQAPSYIKGIINLRGQITPIVDLHALFGMPIKDLSGDSRVIITEVNGETVGILVDSVLGVQRIGNDDIVPLPELARNDDDTSIIGIAKKDDKLIILIDIQRLLTKPSTAESLGEVVKGAHAVEAKARA